jgi:aspartate kinase
MTTEQLIVQKYGGSSLSSPERVREIAAKIAARARHNAAIVVTVSAMGKSTDNLLALAYQVTSDPSQRELDMLLTVGERVSMALLSMALNSLGCPAISFTGSQSGIVTNVSHTRAIIEEIRAQRIRAELGRGKVVIVAGFQGVSREKEITTLGRGGSDTTAVAIAAALDAARCEVYSDYPGVFTADPRWVGTARAIHRISYDEMLELAALGARVLHYRAAEIARRYRVPLHLLSSFEEAAGTTVEEDVQMEHARPTSITCNPNVTRVRFVSPGTLDDVIERLGQSDHQVISCDKESSSDGTTLSLILDRGDMEALAKAIGELLNDRVTMETRDDLATVSVVGSGFACNAGAVFKIERLLSQSNIPVSFVTTSSLSVTCVIPEADCKRAVDILHSSLFDGSDV